MNATETTQLTGPALANLIDSATSAAAPDDDHAQICLWFDGVAGRGPYAGDTVGVESATVTTHPPGGGVCRGGDHVDYRFYLADWRAKGRAAKVRKAWRLIDAALAWSAENLAAIDHPVDGDEAD
jgi:hypothetical protein